MGSDDGIGRHEGLKIPCPVMGVRVQVPLGVLKKRLIETLMDVCISFSFYYKDLAVS